MNSYDLSLQKAMPSPTSALPSIQSYERKRTVLEPTCNSLTHFLDDDRWIGTSTSVRTSPASLRMICALVLFFIALVPGCGSTKETGALNVEERFQKAKSLFDEGNYLEAINEFTVITLQFQGSSRAAEAQYYMGECRFKRGEYLLAIVEYEALKRNMPASPLVQDAQYKIGLCYYNLSPKSALDQQYTRKAIDEFQTFVEYYPSHSLAPDAAEKIKELTKRLAKKAYDTAQLYTTMEYYKAAQFYYDDVIEKYHDTEYAPLAYLDKVDLLLSHNRAAEALSNIAKFLDRYPNSVLRSRAETQKTSAEELLRKNTKSTPAGQPAAETVPVPKGTMN